VLATDATQSGDVGVERCGRSCLHEEAWVECVGILPVRGDGRGLKMEISHIFWWLFYDITHLQWVFNWASFGPHRSYSPKSARLQ
jgi:hypothetical protein